MHSMVGETRILVSNRDPEHAWWESTTGFSIRHYVVWDLGQPDPQPQKNSSTGFQTATQDTFWESERRSLAVHSLTASFVCVVWTVLLSEHSALLTPRAFISQIIRVFRVTAELLEHVCKAGARFLQRRGAEHPLPASPRMQGWRRRRSVLVASALHQPGGPGCRRLILRLDPHSLGSTLREGNRNTLIS